MEITCDIVGEPCPRCSQRPQRPQRPQHPQRLQRPRCSQRPQRPQRPRPRPRCRIHTRTSTARPTNTTRPTHKTAPASSHGDRGRGRGWAGGRGSAYSLTPPAVRPETMYFCRYWNSRITGTAAITEPAAKTPHGVVFWSAAHMYMPTARVNW